jgi:transposase
MSYLAERSPKRPGESRRPIRSRSASSAVRFVRHGSVSVKQAADTVGCSVQTMRNWVLQADRDDGVRHDGLTTDEKVELAHLRRRARVLEQEKEILKIAAAWFAKETHSTP